MSAELIAEADEVCADLARLVPFLTAARLADAGARDAHMPNVPTRDVYRSMVNRDVLDAIALAYAEARSIDAAVRERLNEGRHRGATESVLRCLPEALARLGDSGEESDVADFVARLWRLHEVVRKALRLVTPDRPLNHEHKGCGGQLYLQGRQAVAHVRVGAGGRVVIDAGSKEPVTWGAESRIACRGCEETWHTSQARWLVSAAA